MPQGDLQETYRGQISMVENAHPTDIMSVEFMTGEPNNLRTNPKRIWVDQSSGTLRYTVDGVVIHDVGGGSAGNRLDETTDDLTGIPAGKVVHLTQDAIIANPIGFGNGTYLQSAQRRTLQNTNSPTGNMDFRISGQNVQIENVELMGVNSVSAVYPQPDTKGFRMRNSKITALGDGMRIQSDGVNDVIIDGVEINAEKYGILVNSSAAGKGLRILNSTIHAQRYDAIELNNPSALLGDAYAGQQEVWIIGNKLSADTPPDNPKVNSGFAIGIANTHHVIVIGNISDMSRQEGLHIEDGQENVVAIGNVFFGCGEDGARVLSNDKNGTLPDGTPRTPIISNNFFIKNSTKGFAGIHRVYDTTGSVAVMAANNYVKGFDVGISAEGGGKTIHVEGVHVEDCNYVVLAGINVRVIGTIVAMNTPEIARGAAGAIIESVISDTFPTSVLTYVGAVGAIGAMIRRFVFPSPLIAVIASANIVDLFAIPSRMQGRITIRGGFGTDKGLAVTDVLWDGVDFTPTPVLVRAAGRIGPITLLNNAGKLAMRFTSSAEFNITFSVEFEGTYYQE